jgi:plastocyanin
VPARFARLLAALAVAALVLVGCGDDGGGGEDAGPSVPLTEGDEVEVLAIDNVFEPEDIRIRSGTTIRWVNNGRNDHNIIPEDEDADWRVDTEDFVPGDEVEFEFNESGSYRYYCSIHGTIDVGMIGSVTVE